MWKEVLFLLLTLLLSLYVAVISSWYTCNNQIVGVKLNDILFEIMPDLSDRFALHFPTYVLMLQLSLGLVSLFSSTNVYKYTAQFIFLQALVTALRAISVAVTTLPNIQVYEHCETPITSFAHAFSHMLNYGTCGDYMFSGHTAMASLIYLFVREHSRYYVYAIISVVLLVCQIVFLILLRWHYSVDILIGCIITAMLFRNFKAYEKSEKWSDYWFFFGGADTKRQRSTIKDRKIIDLDFGPWPSGAKCGPWPSAPPKKDDSYSTANICY